MQIFVVWPFVKAISLEIEATDTIEDVKAKIENKEGIPLYAQQLMFATKLLEDDYTVSDYNIQNHSVVFLNLNYRLNLRG